MLVYFLNLFIDGFNIAGWSSPVARQAHNLKVVGSNPTPATKLPWILQLKAKLLLFAYNIPRKKPIFFIFYDLTRNFYTIIGTNSFLIEKNNPLVLNDFKS